MPPIDPTVLALLSIFGGVVLTITAGAIGALIQHRREHGKWLRDQRLRVYTEFLAAHDGLIRINDSGSEPGTEQRLIRSVGAVQLVGPDDVSAAAIKHSEVMMGMVGAAIQRRAQRKASAAATDAEVQAATVTRGEFMRLARQYVQKG